jgi:serine/threonine protein kinase
MERLLTLRGAGLAASDRRRIERFREDSSVAWSRMDQREVPLAPIRNTSASAMRRSRTRRSALDPTGVEAVILGDSFGRFRLIAALGRPGGFGQVFKAERDEALFAVKILHREPQTEAEREQFRREIRGLEKFSHENLVDFADAGVETLDGHDRWWIAMPFLDGRTVAEECEAHGGRVRAARARYLARGMAYGLAELHRHNVIHRDLKPLNAFVTSDDVVKLLDFGIARFLDYTSLTERGHFRGTLAYAAPEQIRGEPELSTDLWALGVSLYEMVTGTRPFGGGDMFALLEAIRVETPESPAALVPGVDPDLEELIMALLEKEPMNRPASADEVGDRLQPQLAAATIQPEPYGRELEPRIYWRVGQRDVNDAMNACLHGDTPTGIVVGITDGNALVTARQAARNNEVQAEFAVDPLLLRLGLTNFSNTKGLKGLPYAPSGLSPWQADDFRSMEASRVCARRVIQEQQDCGATQFFSAHFFFRDLEDPWLRRNAKLLDDSLMARDAIDAEKPLIALIAGALEPLCREDALLSLVNRLRRGRPDAFWLMLDSVRAPGTEVELIFTLRLALLLQDLGVPAIVARAGALRHFFLACGVAGVETGLGRSNGFRISDFKGRGPGYTPPQFEFPSLLMTLPQEKARSVLESDLVPESSCSCSACNGRSVAERLEATPEHNAAMLRVQRSRLAGIGTAGRIEMLRSDIASAAALRRRLRILQAFTDEMPHLTIWARALDEVEQSGLLEPGRAARRAV